MARYRMLTEWHVSAPLPSVWDVLLDVRAWPGWWRGFRSVEVVGPGDRRGVGMRVVQRWRSHLPYTLRLELEIVEVTPHGGLEGRIGGDMTGSASWSFGPEDGGTVVRFVMDVRPARWWMNLPVPFAGRIFAANYDAVMRWGSEGIATLMGTGVVDRTHEARLAAAA